VTGGDLAISGLGAALRRTADEGSAHLDGVLDVAVRRDLWREIASGPLRRMAGEFGKAGVRMEIEGYDVASPFEGFPALAELASAFGDRVRTEGRELRGLATWRPNEAGVGLYRPGSVGITAHLDGRWYRRLVAVFTVIGSARFEVRASRAGEIVEAWVARAGSLTLMRGPGLSGAADGRPFHVVHGPRRGVRCSLALRMRVG
jgi:alkylated DNA repair dioxygenase AlkB